MLILRDCSFELHRHRPIRHERGARPAALFISIGQLHICQSGIAFARCVESGDSALWFPGSYGWRGNPHLDEMKELIKGMDFVLFTLKPLNDQEKAGFHSLLEELK
jgi:hypothetical protein